MIIEYKNYYISSGMSNKLYTLRQNVVKKLQDCVYSDDIHIKTLCADKEKAILKAQEYVKDTGFTLIVKEFEVKERSKPVKIDWTKFQAGKYYKEHYESVCESDPEYVIYLLKSFVSSESYKKTLELCKSHPKIVSTIKAKEEEIERRKREVIENNGHFYKDDEKVVLSLTIINIIPFQTSFGSSNIVNLKDSEGKRFVYIGNSSFLNFKNKLNSGSGYFTITAKIKHSNYKGLNQTHLKNPSIKIDNYSLLDENNKVLLEVSPKEYKNQGNEFYQKISKIQEENPSSIPFLQFVAVSGGSYSYL